MVMECYRSLPVAGCSVRHSLWTSCMDNPWALSVADAAFAMTSISILIQHGTVSLSSLLLGWCGSCGILRHLYLPC